ncbi:hypothetical protein UlMin_025344 [Ulmus minor]
MADSTPFLSQPNSEAPTQPESHHLPSLDSTIEKCIGEFGPAQFLQAILVSFAWFFDAQQTFVTVFTDAEPAWHWNNSNGTHLGNICLLDQDSWSWDLPKHASIISEWNLQCASSFLAGLPASGFFIGCLIGGIVLATLADSFLGRKKMLLFSCLAMSISTFFTSFSTNIWIYSFLRFVCGFGRATIGTSALVLATELVGKKWHAKVGVIGFFCFTLGFLSLPAMAYYNIGSTWRNIYLWTSIPTIFYCLIVFYFVRESPRWLLVRGRKEDAIATLRTMAQFNHNTTLTMSFTNLPFQEGTSSENDDVYSAIKVLTQKKWAFRRLLSVMAIGFGIGLVYYGMPLALGNLSFNLYLSVTFNALSELPASLVTFFLVGKLNRRTSLVFFTIISSIFSIMSVLEGEIFAKLQIGLELVSFFSACTAFNILLIFTIELFPTCVRNSAVSMVRQALVFGGVFSPMVAAAGRENGLLSYGVFGLVIGCFGLFSVCLPETRGRALSDTIDEEESKDRECNRNGSGVGDV